MNGRGLLYCILILPYKFVWEEVSPILYGADTLLYDPLALFEGKGTFVYQVVDSS